MIFPCLANSGRRVNANESGGHSACLRDAARYCINIHISKQELRGIHQGDTVSEELKEGEHETNVLARVDGGMLSAGIRALPDPKTATATIVEVPMMTVRGEPVLVTYERHSYKYHRNIYTHWQPTQAVLTNATVGEPKLERGES